MEKRLDKGKGVWGSWVGGKLWKVTRKCMINKDCLLRFVKQIKSLWSSSCKGGGDSFTKGTAF